MSQGNTVALALVEALSALRMAEDEVRRALATLDNDFYPPRRERPAVRTTGTQIMAVLARAGEPMNLIDIADAVIAMRRDEDAPRKRGGTRYQEICRTALQRLIERALVRRIEPTTPRGRMHFELTTLEGRELHHAKG